MSRLADVDDSLPTDSLPRGLRLWIIPAVIMLAMFQCGCVTHRTFSTFSQRDPMAGAPRLQNASNPHKEELVAHLNRNISRIHGWRANGARIQVGGISLAGKLAVERDRHVRLVVSSPLRSEVDLGSNDEGFWVWSRHMDPAFVTCRHENIVAARQKLGVPFEPDFLMQALSVMPISASEMSMEVDTADQKARLVQSFPSAHGRPLRRVVLVDLKKGNGIIVEHSLYDGGARPLALAKLRDHRLDRESGAVLAHHVSLEWPAQQMKMSMELGKIQINPPSIPSEIWDMPKFPGVTVTRLDEGILPDRPVVLGQIEDAPADDDAVAAGEVVVEDKEWGQINREERPSATRPAGHSQISEEDDSPPAAGVDDEW